MKPAYAPFDPADYLDNDEVIAEYLSAAVEDPDPNVFLAAKVFRAPRKIFA